MSRLVEVVTTGLVEKLASNIMFVFASTGSVGLALHTNIFELGILLTFCFLTFPIIDTIGR